VTLGQFYEDAWVTLYHGDCLDVLADLDLSVHAVITDPPYASGTRLEAAKTNTGKTMLRAGRFSDRPIDLDQMTTTGFVWLLRAVAVRSRPMLVDGGSFLSFIDWRQWPNLVGALETANLRIQGMVVWDKGHFGMGNGFRSQHELICHASKGVPAIYNKGIGNVLSFPRQEPIDHPSPKPEGVMQRLIEAVVPVGGLVLDPFAGSGTTLRAAKNTGRRAIGVESDESYCRVAADRLAQEVLALDTPDCSCRDDHASWCPYYEQVA
jgi:site-specific DNA-methyltransferase (adenine-specific)